MKLDRSFFVALVGRLGNSGLAFLAIVGLSYSIMHYAPGKPFEGDKAISPEVLAELKLKYDFTFFQYLEGLVLRGDLGYSYHHRDIPVSNLIGEALPISLELGAYSLSFALVVGLGMGFLAALRRGRREEGFILGLALLGIAAPSFAVGALLQLAFSLELRWTPIAGWDTWESKVLPVITLSLAYIAYITRIFRGSLLDNLGRDFVRTARAKGLSESTLYWKHLLRNSAQPVLNFLAPATAAILTGTLVVEKIFNIPGLGRYFIESVFQRDYPLALGVIVVYSGFLLALNLLADLLQVLLDPRVEFR
jgi:oligopeptide transport system permease protein